MENLNLKKVSLQRAISRLKESLELIQEKQYDVIYDSLRDSSIQRFEFTFDTFWKFLKAYLITVKNVDSESLISPRGIFRAAQQALVISPEELIKIIDMYEDRNKTSHTYEEKIAEDIFINIPCHLEIVETITKRLSTPHE